MLGHLFCCLWIYVGFWDKNLPSEQRESWLYVNDWILNDDEDVTFFENS